MEEVRASTTGTVIRQSSDRVIVTFGQGVCRLLEKGQQPVDIALAMIKGESPSQLSGADASIAISAAAKFLCPDRYGAIQGWNGGL